MRHRPPEQLLSVTQAAAVSGIAASTIYRLCRDNHIPYTKIGSVVAITDRTAERLREIHMPPEGHITVREAMEIAGVSRSRVHQLIKEEKVKGFRRRWLGLMQVWVDRESLMEYLKGREK